MELKSSVFQRDLCYKEDINDTDSYAYTLYKRVPLTETRNVSKAFRFVPFTLPDK